MVRGGAAQAKCKHTYVEGDAPRYCRCLIHARRKKTAPARVTPRLLLSPRTPPPLGVRHGGGRAQRARREAPGVDRRAARGSGRRASGRQRHRREEGVGGVRQDECQRRETGRWTSPCPSALARLTPCLRRHAAVRTASRCEFGLQLLSRVVPASACACSQQGSWLIPAAHRQSAHRYRVSGARLEQAAQWHVFRVSRRRSRPISRAVPPWSLKIQSATRATCRMRAAAPPARRGKRSPASP